MLKLLPFLLLVFPTDESIDCLARAVYHEARGESERGQEAVAYVVKNRLHTGDFPNSICEIVYQSDQFTDIKKTVPNKKSEAWKKAKDIASEVLSGGVKDPTKGATYFYAQHKVRPPKWAKLDSKPIVIGNHTFIRNK